MAFAAVTAIRDTRHTFNYNRRTARGIISSKKNQKKKCRGILSFVEGPGHAAHLIIIEGQLVV